MTETFASLGSSLPKADGNGLSDMGPELLRDRKKIRAAVILFDCSEMVEKTDTGDRIAKVRIRRIEVIHNREDAAIMQRLLMRAWEERTGAAVLPFELEQEVIKAFESFDEGEAEEKTADEPLFDEGEGDPKE